ncbi:MAG: hypothetical protein LKJ45_04455 [Oscillospiraceae bacterium]|jgi:hypothetical protein|nr:hypothetical protein [Oscillospiraceae bacterium]
MVKKAIWKSCLFLVIIGTILAALSPLFIYKIDHRGKLLQGLYKSDDTYDVVLMGSSHMNGGIDPNVLWHEYGISSFNYATGGQPIDVTYYLLKEVLKKHKNPLVVVDVYYLGMTDPYGVSGFVSNALDNVHFSFNKMQAIHNCVPFDERLFYYFPMLKYHFRWSVLTQKDFTYDSASVYYAKGFGAGTSHYGKQDISYANTQKKAAIPPKALSYLNKIIELSKKENFPLLLINLPCDYTDSNKEDGWVNDCEAMFNTVADVAEKNGVAFLDLCDRMDEIGLDFSQDMNNAGHLNIWGAVKTSDYLGKYLKENYSLSDHRSESAYAQWNEDYKKSQASSAAGG